MFYSSNVSNQLNLIFFHSIYTIVDNVPSVGLILLIQKGQSSMWADLESDIDYLNFSEVANIAADTITKPSMLPLSLGVFGGWGAGKSTLLRLVENELQNQSGTFIFVRFDAWLYQGLDDARAALMESISNCLETAATGNEQLQEKVIKISKRINYFRVAGLAAEAGAAIMGLPMFGAIAKGVDVLEKALSDDEPTDGSDEQLADVYKGIKGRLKGIVRKESDRTPPKEIAAFRKDFEDILISTNKTMVVFIDNLDRCLPKNAIQTLEVIRLFLFVKHTAFVIAADVDMIKHAVSEHYGGLEERHIVDYLDKFIQVPMHVPRLGVHEMRAYLYLLFASQLIEDGKIFEDFRAQFEASLKESWKQAPFTMQNVIDFLNSRVTVDPLVAKFEMAERIAPLLVKSSAIQGNPRIVKRMLNTIIMRSAISRKRQMPLDEAVIAKLALFERCTNANSTAELYSMINNEEDGKLPVLSILERTIDRPDDFIKHCPEAWQGSHLEFMQEWIQLEPLLGGVDLRPAVYLSRETIPLSYSKFNLSAKGREAMEALLAAKSRNSRIGIKLLDALLPVERIAVLEALISEFRKVSDWSKKPKGFNGALCHLDNYPEDGAPLSKLIKELKNKDTNPPWLRSAIKGAEWLDTGGS